MNPEKFKARIQQIYGDLDAYTYYELLKLTPEATIDDIRQAFHRMALSTHPDRFQQSNDAELRKQIYAIYKRICEGYQVLTQPKSRAEYAEALARGERRLVRKQRQTSGPKRAEAAISNANAKRFFTMAQAAERRGDLKSARMNYQFAFDLEAHPAIEARLAALSEDPPA